MVLHQHLSCFTQLSYARDTHQTWPFVTIPDFESRVQRALGSTFTIIFMHHLVTNETRLAWEAYSAEHGRNWVEDSMAFLKKNDLFQDVYKERNISEPILLDFIHDYSAWGVENPKGIPYDRKFTVHVLSFTFLRFINAHEEVCINRTWSVSAHVAKCPIDPNHPCVQLVREVVA